MGHMKSILTESLHCLQQGFGLLWGSISHGLPTLIVALLMVVIGSLLASYIGELISSIMKKAGIDKSIDSILSPISKLVDARINSAKLVGETVKWVLLITVLIATFNMLKLSAVVSFFKSALSYLPSVFVAVFIMIVGYLLANLVANLIAILTKNEHAYLTNLSKAAVYTFSGIAALSIVLTPLASALGRFLGELHISSSRSDALFIGLVVLLVLASKNLVTKVVEKLFE